MVEGEGEAGGLDDCGELTVRATAMMATAVLPAQVFGTSIAIQSIRKLCREGASA